MVTSRIVGAILFGKHPVSASKERVNPRFLVETGFFCLSPNLHEIADTHSAPQQLPIEKFSTNATDLQAVETVQNAPNGNAVQETTDG